MKDNRYDGQRIDDFLFGSLSQEEEKQFQKKLEADHALAEETTLRREILYGVEAYGRKSMKEELKLVHAEVIDQENHSAKRRKLIPYLAAAASILLLIISLTWLMNRNANDLYLAYFEPFDISENQRAEGDANLMRIEQLYENKKYKEVLNLIESHLVDLDSKPSNLLLGAGISYLELNEPNKALSYFEQISNNKDFNFEDEVTWYSALAYLKLEDIKSSKSLLRTLAEDNRADHHTAAVELLKDLE